VKHDTDHAGKSGGKRVKNRRLPETAASVPIVKSPAMRRALLVSAVIGFAFCAYSNSFDAPFLLDNDPIILKDTRLRAVTSDHVQRILNGEYWPLGMSGLYRPLTTFSYMFNYSVLGNGANPSGYHWLNFTLHAVNIGLVYLLGLLILEQLPAALLLAAIWGIHPVLTESVTNIVGRADLLGAFGVLAALLAHRQALDVSGGRKVAWLAAIALAVTAGIFSKESTVVVVAVIAIYDLSFGRAASWKARLPSYFAAVIPCLVFLYVRAQVLGGVAATAFPFGDNPLMGADFWTARMTAVKVIGRYLALLAWPAGLSFDYSYNENPLFGWGLTSWEDVKTILSLLVCLAGVAGTIVCWRRRKPVFFAIAFFFATLSPTSNLVVRIGSIMAERFLYLPSVGFAVLVVYGVNLLSQRLAERGREYRNAVPVAMGVMLLAFAARTYGRNADWVDQGRFWRSAVEAAPGSYKTNLSAANNTVFISQQDWDRSIGQVGRALTILDNLPDLQNTGIAYQQAGVFYRNLGIRLASSNPAGRAEAGSEYWYGKSLNALLRSEKIELAQDERNRAENAKRGKPGLTFVPSALYLHMGRTYQKLGDPGHALEAFERGRALESDPDLLEELASAYRTAGETRKAAMALVEALAVDSSRMQLASKLVELYSEIDPSGCAVSREGGTPGLNVDCPLVHGDICTASRNVAATYLRTWQYEHAAAIRRTAIQELGCAPELLK
jgi:tetratricopeptide (TPR) repeat protein